MADAKQAKQAKAKPAKKGGGSVKVVVFMTILGCLAPFGLPTLLVCMGLLPTFVALFSETDGRGSGVAAIGYMNLAGVLPFLVDLWQKGQTMDVAMAIVRDPQSWVVMLGAAGVGHLILYAIPQAVVSFVYNRQQARLKDLRDAVKELESIWGPEVATAAPVDVVLQNRGVE